MRLSIIVPVYNSVALLPSCVNSVLSQDVSDWELILVDDGSTDGSERLVDDYAALMPQIRVVHQANAGQFFARQGGIDVARGEYLLFLDSDDILLDGCLGKLEACLRQHEPDIVLFTGMTFVESPKKPLGPIGLVEQRESWLDLSALRRRVSSSDAWNSLCLKAFRRCLFEGDTTDYSAMRGMQYGEDKVRLLYPLTRAQSAYYLPDCLYGYRQHHGSVMDTWQPAHVRDRLQNHVFALLWEYMQQWGLTDDAARHEFAAYYLRNYLDVYFGLRRRCHSSRERKGLRRIPWDEMVDQAFFKAEYVLRLKPRDVLRYCAARLCL